MTDKAIARQRRPLVSGLIWLGLGIYLLLIFNGVIPSVEDSWPVILIIMGGALVVRGIVRK
jgi:hypothetical protein